MKIGWVFLTLLSLVMKKAWGEKKHDLPSLNEICRYTTSREVAVYVIGNNLIHNMTGTVCVKIHTYEYSSKTKPPCGTVRYLSIQGPFTTHPNTGYWRCWKCKHQQFKCAYPCWVPKPCKPTNIIYIKGLTEKCSPTNTSPSDCSCPFSFPFVGKVD